jgi:Fe-S cluster assembly iron-binding protein IscA
MALDEPRDDDTVFTESGVTYLVNKGLYDQVKPIKVDFVDTPMGSGFHVTSSPADPKNPDDSKNCCGTCSCS